MTSAIIFVPANLPDDVDLVDRCRAYLARRGYSLTAILRDWSDVEALLRRNSAQVVVFADPTHMVRPVHAEIADADTRRLDAEKQARGRSAVPAAPAVPVERRAVILIPPGQLDPYGARCAEQCDRQGLTIVGVVPDLAAAIKLLNDGEAGVLIVGDDDHLDCGGVRQPRIQVVSNMRSPSGQKRSQIIRRPTGAAE